MTKQHGNQYDISAFENGRDTFKQVIEDGTGKNIVETECYNGYWRINMLFAHGERASINLCLPVDDPQKGARLAEMLHNNAVALVGQGHTFEEIEEIISRLEDQAE